LVEEIQRIRSRLGDQLGRATCQAIGPEKTDGFREKLPGSETAKAVIASGAAMVRAATLLTLSQELVARAQPISQPFLFVPQSFPALSDTGTSSIVHLFRSDLSMTVCR
jgi:hypothetical protein